MTGKPHNDVMKAIRRMEPAWQKVQGGNFSLSHRTYELPNGGFKKVPCYELTKTECLYIATKFNDEARARLVLRWQELETAWERVNGRKFALVEYKDAKGERRQLFTQFPGRSINGWEENEKRGKCCSR